MAALSLESRPSPNRRRQTHLIVARHHRYKRAMRIAQIVALLLAAFGSSTAVAQSTQPAIPDEIQQAIAKVPIKLGEFKEAQFVAFDPNYVSERAARGARLRKLAAEVFTREAAGQDVQRPHRMVLDAYWFLSSTADFKRADERLAALKQFLDSATTRPSTTPPDPSEIVLPPSTTVWYLQLDAAYDQLDLDPHFQFPAEILDRINSPEKLTAYFKSVSVSDIAHNGIDHEEEQNEPLADLVRLILRHEPENYQFDPKVKETILDLILHQLRDPVTGYWGESYVADGQTIFVPDLSTTFHVVSYLSGEGIEIPDMDRIVATTLAVKDRSTPVGWTDSGRQYNHNCMDVVELFKRCWPHANDAQKTEIAVETQKMIHRCLTESLQADGSFKHLSADSSIEEAEYFGASFLVRAGYFDASVRFWSTPELGDQIAQNPDFAQAADVRLRIIAFIKKHLASGATGGVFYKSALEGLKYDPVKDGA
jgi:hypothetical protein